MLIFDVSCTFNGVVVIDVLEDIADLLFVVAEFLKAQIYGLVNNFEHAATGKLLVFDQRDIRLDPCCVTGPS